MPISEWGSDKDIRFQGWTAEHGNREMVTKAGALATGPLTPHKCSGINAVLQATQMSPRVCRKLKPSIAGLMGWDYSRVQHMGPNARCIVPNPNPYSVSRWHHRQNTASVIQSSRTPQPTFQKFKSARTMILLHAHRRL